MVSGPPGAGKSTVARAAAARFERSVHLHTDDFYNAIVSGYIDPWLLESGAQNRVGVTAAARAAIPYAEAGYELFVDGVVRRWALEIYMDTFRGTGLTLHYAVLLPSVEAVVERGMARPPPNDVVPRDVYGSLHDQFVAEGLDAGSIDSTSLDAEATVDVLLQRRARGDFLIDL